MRRRPCLFGKVTGASSPTKASSSSLKGCVTRLAAGSRWEVLRAAIFAGLRRFIPEFHILSALETWAQITLILGCGWKQLSTSKKHWERLTFPDSTWSKEVEHGAYDLEKPPSSLEVDAEDPKQQCGQRGWRTMLDTKISSRSEVQQRCLTHMPSRNWCPYCVRCGGEEMDHRSREAPKRRVCQSTSWTIASQEMKVVRS